MGTNSQQEGFLVPSVLGQKSNLELITQWSSKQGLGFRRPKSGSELEYKETEISTQKGESKAL